MEPSFIKLVIAFLHNKVALADVQETYTKAYAAMHEDAIRLQCFAPVLHLLFG
jgi:hypothetical protein